MVQRVKNLTCIDQDAGSIPGPGNFHMPCVWPKKLGFYFPDSAAVKFPDTDGFLTVVKIWKVEEKE